MSKRILYGLQWHPSLSEAKIEIQMIRRGGQWLSKSGAVIGNGLYYHYKRLEELLWPKDKVWHAWNELQLENYLMHRTCCVIGPASCVAGHTKIYDPETGKSPTIKELCDSKTHPTVMTLFGKKIAGIPFVKGIADLYEVRLESGRSFVATADHLVLSSDGDFSRVSDLQSGSMILAYDSFQNRSTSEHGQKAHVSNALNSLKTIEDFQCGCRSCFCSYGEQLPPEAGIAQWPVPSLIYAPAHKENAFCDLDVMESKSSHIHLGQGIGHLSTLGTFLPSGLSETFSRFRFDEGTTSPSALLSQCAGQSQTVIPHLHTTAEPDSYSSRRLRSWLRSALPSSLPSLCCFSSCGEYRVLHDVVSSVRWVGHEEFYDLQVPDYHHYFAEGVIHHNSGKTNGAATDVLTDYYAWPECTTVIICSTTKERLEDRIFGEMKKYHRSAKKIHPWLPGNLIEGRLRIVSDSRADSIDGRDFRNGIIGVPCFLSGTMVDTELGKIPIEKVKVGDTVVNAAGLGVVKSIGSKYSKMAVKLKLCDSREIYCTPEHRFFTSRGWVNASCLLTSDVLLSAHETMSIMRDGNASRIWEQEVLRFGLPGQATSKALRSLRETVPTLEPESFLGGQDHGEILLPGVCGNVVGQPQGACHDPDQVLQELRQADGWGSLPTGVLLSGVSEQAGRDTLPPMRKGIYLNPGIAIEAKISLLREDLQGESDWEGEFEEEGYSNVRGTCCLEAVPGISFSLSPENRAKEFKGSLSLVSTGPSMAGHKTVRGSGWGRPLNTGEKREGFLKDIPPGAIRVDSVEILEPASDPRFNKSEGGYLVHNLEVSGHPSYSVEGVIVHNCKRGGDYVGLGDFIGIKNKRVRMVADELQLLPSAFIMAISNLDKNPDLKVIGLGNPKETTDALGVFGEPAYELGGWDGGIDQTPKTKTWKTRRPDGICIQLVGSDSPNLDGHLGIPLITQAAIDRDIAQYGKDSLQFTMMNQGMMPRGQGSRRVITRQLCTKNNAMDDPNWINEARIRIGFLDAAYKGVGGDRCVFGELQIGYEAGDVDASDMFTNVVSQKPVPSGSKQIIALISLDIVPVNVKIDIEAEEQIVDYVKAQCSLRNIPPENFFFDSGMRTALVSAFGRNWSPQVMSIDCGGNPSDRSVSAQIATACNKYYSKFITEMWFSVRYAIESGQFRGMTSGVMQEGCQREWTMVGGNRIEIEPKIKMKEKTGKSPDLFDALAIGVEGARQRGFVINNGFKPMRESEIRNTWHRKLQEKAKAQWREGALNYAA